MKGEFISIESARINADIEKENKELQERIDKAIEFTKQFTNGKTSRIDEWKNVELVLETIIELLEEKNENI